MTDRDTLARVVYEVNGRTLVVAYEIVDALLDHLRAAAHPATAALCTCDADLMPPHRLGPGCGTYTAPPATAVPFCGDPACTKPHTDAEWEARYGDKAAPPTPATDGLRERIEQLTAEGDIEGVVYPSDLRAALDAEPGDGPLRRIVQDVRNLTPEPMEGVTTEAMIRDRYMRIRALVRTTAALAVPPTDQPSGEGEK